MLFYKPFHFYLFTFYALQHNFFNSKENSISTYCLQKDSLFVELVAMRKVLPESKAPPMAGLHCVALSVRHQGSLVVPTHALVGPFPLFAELCHDHVLKDSSVIDEYMFNLFRP